VDRIDDLIRVPSEVADVAVLVEPLSVVEKAVAFALRLHEAQPERALVFGAGTIGLLAAMVLKLRGLDVQVASVEAQGSARARLVEAAGAEYASKPLRDADIVIEAAGASEAFMSGLRALRPLGVLMVLGANDSGNAVPLIDLIVGNRVVAGSVNASPEAFGAAVADLPRMPRTVLTSMIERADFGAYDRSILGAPAGAPKVVHVI
jgi:threonine dehydrogenase-like Zn-dependent dehydrogenase